MFQRIYRIISREIQTHPQRPIIISLIKKFYFRSKEKAIELFMLFTKNSTFTKDALWMCSLFPQKVLDTIISQLNPRSVLDVGCGTGVSLSYFLQNGIDTKGVENSAPAIAQSPVKEHILKSNLNKELNLHRKFDLVWSFEVIEHIHPLYEAAFLKTLVNHADVIIISAARPGQGGHGHFNEQQPEYWIHRFDELQYNYDMPLTELLRSINDMHAENILCFKRKIK